MNRARVAKKAGGAPEKAPNVGWRGVKKRRDSDLSTLEDGSEEEEKEEEYLVNPNLHLNSDVPETVQDFIRSISRSGLTDEKEPSSKKMLEEKKKKGRRPCRRDSIPKEVEIERKPSVEVIITSEYEPEKLSNREYDRLKKVQELKLVQCGVNANVFRTQGLPSTRLCSCGAPSKGTSPAGRSTGSRSLS